MLEKYVVLVYLYLMCVCVNRAGFRCVRVMAEFPGSHEIVAGFDM